MPAVVTPAVPENMSTKTPNSYGQILRSTAWVGGSSALNIVIGLARNKITAMLLGTSGFGLAGMFLSVSSFTQSIAGMGVSSSGVRQIAAASESGDEGRVGFTAAVVRRTSVVLGLTGALILVLVSRPVSRLTFGSTKYQSAVWVLSFCVLLNLLSAGQAALIQGMRRISDLAKMSVLGSLFGTVGSIPILYLWRDGGLVYSLVLVSASTLACSWYYSRKVKIICPKVSISAVVAETRALLKLGSAFMMSGLLMMGSAYVIRLILMRSIDLSAVGLYQAAWTLAGLYLSTILQAMGADFYPRLAAHAENHSECNRLVNEQARVGMLLAGPGVIGTLVFAPSVLSAIYAPKFAGAVDVLRWLCMGVAMRTVSWPIGYIIMAKGRQNLLILTECSWTVVHVGLALLLVPTIGIRGAGMAFFGAYLFQVFLNYWLVRKLTGFRWSAENLRTMSLYLGAILVVYCALVTNALWAVIFGAIILLVTARYSLKTLATLVGWHEIPPRVRSILVRLGFHPTAEPTSLAA